MGLFDKLAETSRIQLSPMGALLLSALTLIGIDGAIEDEEISSLKQLARGDADSLKQALQVYKELSVLDCIKLVSNILNEKQKNTVLANLFDLAMADGVLGESEKKLLLAYIQHFEISEEIAKELIDLIAIKNNFSIFE